MTDKADQPTTPPAEDARKYLGFGESPVSVSTPLRGGPDMAGQWLEYSRRRPQRRQPQP